MPVDAPAPTTSRDHKLPHHFKQLRARTKFTQFTLPNEKPGGAIMHKMVPAEGFEPPTTRLRSGCSTTELRRPDCSAEGYLIAARGKIYKARPQPY